MIFKNVNNSGFDLDLGNEKLIINLGHPNTKKKMSLIFQEMKRNEEHQTVEFFLQMLVNRESVLNITNELNDTIQSELEDIKESDPHLFDANGDLDTNALIGKVTIH